MHSTAPAPPLLGPPASIWRLVTRADPEVGRPAESAESHTTEKFSLTGIHGTTSLSNSPLMIRFASARAVDAAARAMAKARIRLFTPSSPKGRVQEPPRRARIGSRSVLFSGRRRAGVASGADADAQRRLASPRSSWRGRYGTPAQAGTPARLLDPRTRGSHRPRARGRAARLRLGVDRGRLRSRRLLAALLDRRAPLAHPARHRRDAALGAHAGLRGDDRDDDRPSLGRASDPRHRRVGPAGRRGLVRPAVPQAPRAHARVGRAVPPDDPPGDAGRLRRPPLPASPARRRRAGQAAHADPPTPPPR